MNKIYLITDYKGNFGSKYRDTPYRSGFDKHLLTSLFNDHNIIAEFIYPGKADFSALAGEIVLYTSQEDAGLSYKSFLEDLIMILEDSGATVIPSFRLFRAHENKVFFEMIRRSSGNPQIDNLSSSWYGTYEEFKADSAIIEYPVVLKSYRGSMSRGVFLAKTQKEACRIARILSSTPGGFNRQKDFFRQVKHSGYVKESWNRNKFIIQKFIPGLKNDFKVLVYGERYYVLLRSIRGSDFRASGKGILSFIKEPPAGLLDFSKDCFDFFNVPHASFDIGFDGKEYFLFEAQFLYFGTYTIEFSEWYFVPENGSWKSIQGPSFLEEEYVRSVVEYLAR